LLRAERRAGWLPLRAGADLLPPVPLDAGPDQRR
jgi:hypothetical protein